MNALKNVGLWVSIGIVFLAAVIGIFYVPLEYGGVLALVSIWMVLGTMAGGRKPPEMSLTDYLKSRESYAAIGLAALMFFVLLLVYAIREVAKAETEGGPDFVWKSGEILGFLVVGIGGFSGGFLIGAFLRRSANHLQLQRSEMFYVNYDRFIETEVTATIHQYDCRHVQSALEEEPENMKRVNDGYWLALRRMEDAVQASLDLGATIHYCHDCWRLPRAAT